MNIEQTMVNIFLDEGVNTVFGLPCMQHLKLYDAIRGESRLRHILCKHEQGVGFAGLGYSLVKNVPAVCLVMPGPGITNILSAVAESFYQSVPLVVISLDNPPTTLGTGAFHELNSKAVLAPVVKRVLIPEKPQEILEVLRKGFYFAKSGRPGPVFVNLPLNLFGKDVGNIPGKMSRKNPRIKREEVVQVARLLKSAKNPLIWAGEGVIRAQAVSLLAELAKTLNIPVMTNIAGRGAFDETNPLSLRVPIYDLPLDTLKGADLILAIGIKLTAMNTRNYALPLPKNLIQLDIEPGKRCIQKKKLEIKACPQEFLTELLKELKGKIKKEIRKNFILDKFKAALKDYHNSFESIASEEVSPVVPPRFLKELVEYLDHKEFIYITDSVWGAHCYHSPAISGKAPHITMGSFGCLGLALPAAIGAAIASPEKLIISLSGDGSFLFNSQELSTAADLNLRNLIQVVFVDNGYGSLKHLQNFLCAGRSFAVDWKPIDFIKLAQGLGIEGLLIREPQEIKKTLKQAEELDGPTLIAVETKNIPTMPEKVVKALIKGAA